LAGAGAEALTPPAKAPALALVDLQGRQHTLTMYRGKVVLVNFWASWCGPCVQEIPSLRRLYERMAGEAFEILAVNVDEKRFKVWKFSELVGMRFPVLLDTGGEAFDRWGAEVLPSSYLIDREGIVQYAVYGPMDWAGDDVIDVVRGLLGAAPAAEGDRQARRRADTGFAAMDPMPQDWGLAPARFARQVFTAPPRMVDRR